MPEQGQITATDLAQTFRQKFSWQEIKTQPIRGVVLVALIILLGTKTVEITATCIATLTTAPNFPQPTNNWSIVDADLSTNMLWQISTDKSPIEYPNHIFTDKHIRASNDRLFYIWDGDSIPGFPCSRQDSAFLTIDLRSGETFNQYTGDETLSVKSIITSNSDFAVVSHDRVVTQFDSNGNRLWGNNRFGSRTLKNIFETKDYYYLPNPRFSYVVDKHNGQNQNDLRIPQIITVFEDIMLVSGNDNEIQIRERDSKVIFNTFHFPKTTDGFGFKPFVTRHKNILLLTQFHHGIQAYDLDQQAIIWSLELPFLENEYPSIIGDYFVIYNKSHPSLEFYDIQTAEFVGRILLENTRSSVESEYVDIATDGNILVIYFQNTHDVIAMEVSF